MELEANLIKNDHKDIKQHKKKLSIAKAKKCTLHKNIRSDKKNRSFIEFLFQFEVYYRRYATEIRLKDCEGRKA